MKSVRLKKSVWIRAMALMVVAGGTTSCDQSSAPASASTVAVTEQEPEGALPKEVLQRLKKFEGDYYKTSHKQFMHILRLKDQEFSYVMYWQEGPKRMLAEMPLKLEIKHGHTLSDDEFMITFEVMPIQSQFNFPWTDGGEFSIYARFISEFGTGRFKSFKNGKSFGFFEPYTDGFFDNGNPKAFIRH